MPLDPSDALVLVLVRYAQEFTGDEHREAGREPLVKIDLILAAELIDKGTQKAGDGPAVAVYHLRREHGGDPASFAGVFGRVIVGEHQGDQPHRQTVGSLAHQPLAEAEMAELVGSQDSLAVAVSGEVPDTVVLPVHWIDLAELPVQGEGVGEQRPTHQPCDQGVGSRGAHTGAPI
jgi:hypothetical protein